MTDVLGVLEANVAKLVSKVERARSQLAALETELAESETAIRVLKRMSTGNGEVSAPRNSQSQVLAALPNREPEALMPKEVHQALVDSGVTTISADNVRTILSRCLKGDNPLVLARDGRYWRNDPDAQRPPAPARRALSPDDVDDFEPLIGKPKGPFDDDLDSEIPF